MSIHALSSCIGLTFKLAVGILELADSAELLLGMELNLRMMMNISLDINVSIIIVIEQTARVM